MFLLFCLTALASRLVDTVLSCPGAFFITDQLTGACRVQFILWSSTLV